MIPRDVKSPTAPIPFHKLLKVVAIVDPNDEQTRGLLDHIKAENFEIEISDNYERDVTEDADVGAYIALVDGDRLERARKLARSVRDIGFRTPLWVLAIHTASGVVTLSQTERNLPTTANVDARNFKVLACWWIVQIGPISLNVTTPSAQSGGAAAPYFPHSKIFSTGFVNRSSKPEPPR